MHWLILLLFVPRIIFSADSESKKEENNEKTLEQIQQILTLTLKPIFGVKNPTNFFKKVNWETTNFGEMSEKVKEIGFEKLTNKLTEKLAKISKSEKLIGKIDQIKNIKSKLDEKWDEYSSEMEENLKMDSENGKAKIHTNELFGLFVYAQICEKKLDQIKMENSCKNKNKEIEFLKNYLNKMRRNLHKNFEETKRNILEILKKDGEKMEKLKEKNDEKFKEQKTRQWEMLENLTKNIEKEAEIAQMKSEFLLFFQRFEESHRFDEDKIYEVASKNGEIRQILAQLNVGEKAFQIVNLKIRLTLFDGIERAMEESEMNSMLFDDESNEHFELISISKLLIESFVEQKEMTAEKTEKFLQILSKIKHLKLEEAFGLLFRTEFKFKLSSHRNSLEHHINFLINSTKEKFSIKKLWEYLSEFKEFGLDINSLNKTEKQANEFGNLLVYDELYKAFFSQFFSGEKCQNVLENFPKSFNENFSPEEYAAYWLIVIGKSLRKNLVSVRQELITTIEGNLVILEKKLKEKMDEKICQFKNNYNKMVKNARKLASEERRKVGDETLATKTKKIFNFSTKSGRNLGEMEQGTPSKAKKKENVQRMSEKHAEEVENLLAKARKTNLAIVEQLGGEG